MRLKKCENALNSWSIDNNPYEASFEPSIVYNSIYDTIDKWTLNIHRLENTVTKYAEESNDLYDAVDISHDFRSHKNLLQNYILNQKNVDSFIPFSISSNDTEQIANQDYNDILSLIMADRKPIIITPGITAKESNFEIYIETSVHIPKVLLTSLVKFKPLLKTNRMMVVPHHEYLNSNITNSDDKILDITFNYTDDNWPLIANSKSIISEVAPKLITNNLSIKSFRPYFYFLDSAQASQTFVEEHAESYEYFMLLVKKLQIKLSTAQNESDVALIFHEIDEQFLLLDQKYKIMQTKLRNKGIEVIAGLTATSLSLGLPEGIDIIKYIMSSTTIFSGMQYFTLDKEKEDEMKLSPYWLPWKAKRLNKAQKIANKTLERNS